MKVAIYARVSTLRQQQSQTIDQQLDRLRVHIAAQGWELAEEHIFRDDGYSGAKLTRPGLEHLREQAAQGGFERVLITAPDRLARNYVHQVLLLEELTAQGCQVEFVDRPASDDPHDQLVLQNMCQESLINYLDTSLNPHPPQSPREQGETQQSSPFVRGS